MNYHNDWSQRVIFPRKSISIKLIVNDYQVTNRRFVERPRKILNLPLHIDKSAIWCENRFKIFLTVIFEISPFKPPTLRDTHTHKTIEKYQLKHPKYTKENKKCKRISYMKRNQLLQKEASFCFQSSHENLSNMITLL